MSQQSQEQPQAGVGATLLEKIKSATQFKTGLGLLGIIVVLSLSSEYFLTVTNLFNIVTQTSINALLAFGMTFVILSGGIDLSVGSVMAVASAVTAGLLTSGMNMVIAIIGGLIAGTGLGLFNGLVISRLAMPAFIVTLAMKSIARGLTLIYTDGRPISGFNDAFQFLGGGKVGPIPVPVIILVIVLTICYIVLKKTPFGRYVYAIGGSEEAAELSGIKTKVIKTTVFAISGFMASLSGIVLASRLNSAQPTAGTGYELDAIAAVVLGGTSLTGGRGGITGTLIGALIMGVINNGLNLLNVSSFYQLVAKGTVILLAIYLDRRSKQAA
ncbi:ribose transport system permease protein [Halanaerobacter jeridensis]|uniref:Ribose transport system permease protein n=1 Tax=Halanaerobacter jeridensis TaxID=706427 RepID=A0A938XTF5_9FIRM|nr:ribose transport system permease protein [Halanaerobacter jeridensis]